MHCVEDNTGERTVDGDGVGFTAGLWEGMNEKEAVGMEEAMLVGDMG